MEDSGVNSYCDINELKREASELIFEPDWDSFSDSDGIKAETKSIQGSDIKMIRCVEFFSNTSFFISYHRATVQLNFSAEKVAEYCWNLKEKELKKIDSAMGKVPLAFCYYFFFSCSSR
jgi:hypothetical protein